MPGRPPVDVARVKQLLASGLAQWQVCKRLGVSKSVVSMIAAGKYQETTT